MEAFYCTPKCNVLGSTLVLESYSHYRVLSTRVIASFQYNKAFVLRASIAAAQESKRETKIHRLDLAYIDFYSLFQLIKVRSKLLVALLFQRTAILTDAVKNIPSKNLPHCTEFCKILISSVIALFPTPKKKTHLTNTHRIFHD